MFSAVHSRLHRLHSWLAAHSRPHLRRHDKVNKQTSFLSRLCSMSLLNVRRATTVDYRDLAQASPIPSSPQARLEFLVASQLTLLRKNTRKIKQDVLTHTFVGSNFTNKASHVPGAQLGCFHVVFTPIDVTGYTGHVPGVRYTCESTCCVCVYLILFCAVCRLGRSYGTATSEQLGGSQTVSKALNETPGAAVPMKARRK